MSREVPLRLGEALELYALYAPTRGPASQQRAYGLYCRAFPWLAEGERAVFSEAEVAIVRGHGAKLFLAVYAAIRIRLERAGLWDMELPPPGSRVCAACQALKEHELCASGIDCPGRAKACAGWGGNVLRLRARLGNEGVSFMTDKDLPGRLSAAQADMLDQHGREPLRHPIEGAHSVAEPRVIKAEELAAERVNELEQKLENNRLRSNDLSRDWMLSEARVAVLREAIEDWRDDPPKDDVTAAALAREALSNLDPAAERLLRIERAAASLMSEDGAREAVAHFNALHILAEALKP